MAVLLRINKVDAGINDVIFEIKCEDQQFNNVTMLEAIVTVDGNVYYNSKYDCNLISDIDKQNISNIIIAYTMGSIGKHNMYLWSTIGKNNR